MRSCRTIQAVDAHIAGLGVRVVTGGVPAFPGSTMQERREWFIEHSDHLRTFLLTEPRGHSALSGAILQPATHPDADWGVLFIEVTGVLPMCGAGTMAVATVLVDTGMVEVSEPITRVPLDTPIGLIAADVAVQDGKAQSVTITNVPSFVQQEGVVIDTATHGSVSVDVAFGGNYYAFIELASLGIPWERDSADRLISAAREIMDAVNAQARPVHPETGYSGCEHVVFLAPDSNARHTRHVLVNYPGWIDRSPGGTGTSARMALLNARGELPLDTDFVNESFIGTRFTGRLVDRVVVADREAVIPTITGSAWITSFAQFVLDPEDPFPAGFAL
ncbi:proline racemase family protein [Leucobacter musarum]|uniref:proline racemase family protein n=1 Tax=Leucobacter musarum TaxID=1930747 RepID=UPI0006A7BDDF|nr:proline racemase family protein [Leucobacter musarum]